MKKFVFFPHLLILLLFYHIPSVDEYVGDLVGFGFIAELRLCQNFRFSSLRDKIALMDFYVFKQQRE